MFILLTFLACAPYEPAYVTGDPDIEDISCAASGSEAEDGTREWTALIYGEECEVDGTYCSLVDSWVEVFGRDENQGWWYPVEFTTRLTGSIVEVRMVPRSFACAVQLHYR